MAYNTEELYTEELHQMALKYIKKNGWQASQRLQDEARDKATKRMLKICGKNNGV